MSTRSALVTGGTGFIASHLVPALAADGWDVSACGRRERPQWMPAEATYSRADLADGEGLDELVAGRTHVFHLAGASSSASDQEEMERSNVVGTSNVVEAAARADVERVVHMSSTSVYGEEVQLPSPVTEDTEPHPSRGYGKAKWGAEQAVWRSADKGLAAVVLRPVTVYGPRNFKLLGSTILDAAVERYAGIEALKVHDERLEMRLVHVADLVAACMHLATTDDAVGRAFNVVSPHYPSSHEVAELVTAELSMGMELDSDPDCGPGHDERRLVHRRMLDDGMEDAILLSKERLRFLRKTNRNNRLSVDALLATGFEFTRPDLGGGIAETVAWYRDHRWII